MKEKSLWNDTFILNVPVLKQECRSMPLSMTQNIQKETMHIFFTGSLKGAIKFAMDNFRKDYYGAVSFYTSDGVWLKEIGF